MSGSFAHENQGTQCAFTVTFRMQTGPALPMPADPDHRKPHGMGPRPADLARNSEESRSPADTPSHGLCQAGMLKARRRWFIVCGLLTPQCGLGARLGAG